MNVVEVQSAGTGKDKRQVIEALRDYSKRFIRLVDLTVGKTHFGADKERIKAEYSALKNELREERDSRSTERAKNAMSEVERTYYEPAINQAATDLSAPVNAKIEDLYNAISYARISIDHMLSQLESRIIKLPFGDSALGLQRFGNNDWKWSDGALERRVHNLLDDSGKVVGFEFDMDDEQSLVEKSMKLGTPFYLRPRTTDPE